MNQVVFVSIHVYSFLTGRELLVQMSLDPFVLFTYATDVQDELGLKLLIDVC